MQPVDLTEIVAIVMGMSVVLIPIAGVTLALTARFALKPLVESFSRLSDGQRVEDALQITERRVALLESQLESMEDELRRVTDGADFDRQLKAGVPTPSASGDSTD